MSTDIPWQAMMDQQLQMSREMLDVWKESTKATLDAQAKQFMIQYAQRNLSKKAERAFKRAWEDALHIQSQRHKRLEQSLGAPENSSMPEYTPPWKVIEDAPNVGGNTGTGLDPLGDARRAADKLDEIVAWLEKNDGNSYETMPPNYKEFLAELGYREEDLVKMPKDELISRLKAKAEDMHQKADAIDAFVGPEPDVDAFLDALGERAAEFREEAEAIAELSAHVARMNNAKTMVNNPNVKEELWKYYVLSQGTATGQELWDELGAIIADEYGASAAEDFNYLRSHVTIEASDTPDDIFNKVNEAVKQAQEELDDATDKLYEHAFDPVSPDDANPDDGNQFNEQNKWADDIDGMGESSAMAAASAMLSEEEDVDDLNKIG